MLIRRLCAVAAAAAVWLSLPGCGFLQRHDSAKVQDLAVPKRVGACLRREAVPFEFDDRFHSIGSGFVGGFRITAGRRGDELVLSVYSSRAQAARALPQIEGIVHQHDGGGAVRRRNVVLSHLSRPPGALRNKVRRCAKEA